MTILASVRSCVEKVRSMKYETYSYGHTSHISYKYERHFVRLYRDKALLLVARTKYQVQKFSHFGAYSKYEIIKPRTPQHSVSVRKRVRRFVDLPSVHRPSVRPVGGGYRRGRSDEESESFFFIIHVLASSFCPLGLCEAPKYFSLHILRYSVPVANHIPIFRASSVPFLPNENE